MSTIAIVGGHGKIGLLVSRQLSERGQTVLSVIRNADQIPDVAATGATPVVLDIETADSDALAAAIGSADVVIFTAGAGEGSTAERKETVDHQGAVTSLAAAAAIGASHFLLVSYLSADTPESAGTSPSAVAYQKAKAAADDAVRASSLNWTIVRPGTLNNDQLTGRVTIDESITTGTTSRQNVAALLAELAIGGGGAGQVLNVIDGETPIAQAVR
jgi:uncharacterized protein YbjT (DUF2867 family)